MPSIGPLLLGAHMPVTWESDYWDAAARVESLENDKEELEADNRALNDQLTGERETHEQARRLAEWERAMLLTRAERAERQLRFVLGENRALHHRDGNPHNNDPANLEIVETGDHK